MQPQSLLTLTIPPAIEEALLDWLLLNASQAGFSSYPVSGHSSREEGLSLAEQVAGRQKQIRLQLHLPSAAAPAFLAGLKAEFAGAGLHYWLLPLTEAGHI